MAANGAAPTVFGERQDDGYFLGPSYSKPASKTSLGAEPVGGPTSGPAIKDPLGYTKFPKAGK